jgi:hypothetical protein
MWFTYVVLAAVDCRPGHALFEHPFLDGHLPVFLLATQMAAGAVAFSLLTFGTGRIDPRQCSQGARCRPGPSS